MEGFLSKAIALLLVFLMLIVAPLITIYGSHEFEERNELLSDVSEFLDKVTDKHAITQTDLDVFNMTVQSHGMVLNVEVDRVVKTVTQLSSGENSTTYIAADDISFINPTDIVRVRLTETSMTPFRKLLRTFLNLDRQPYQLTLAKMAK